MDERRNLSPMGGDPSHRYDSSHKRAMIEELVRSRGPAAPALLAEMLGNDSWTLRKLAADGLASLGPQGLEHVLPLATSGVWFTRASAARVLGSIGGFESLPLLIGMLGEDNRTVREAAAGALGEVARRGGSAAVSRCLYNLAPPARESFLVALAGKDAALSERLRSHLADGQLMGTREDDEELWDRSSEELPRPAHGLVWEVLTGGKPRGGPPQE